MTSDDKADKVIADAHAEVQSLLCGFWHQLGANPPGKEVKLIDFSALERAQQDVASHPSKRSRCAAAAYGELAVLKPGLSEQRRRPN